MVRSLLAVIPAPSHFTRSELVALSLAASFLLSLFPWGKYPLYPFKIFTTWVHECCHALMALLMGGRIKTIHISRDASGVTHYQLSAGRIRQSFATSAGYLGSSLTGCMLYFLTLRYPQDAAFFLIFLGILIILSLIFWIRNSFGILAMLLLGSGFIGYSKFFSIQSTQALLTFLSIQTGLNAFFDIRNLLSLDSTQRSDARAMQSHLYLPPWFWTLLWLGLSAGMTLWTIQKT